jgi:hypothetical protein
MCDATNKQKFEKLNFWQLLEKRRVEIPIIQRDYAQGRATKEKVRNDFLVALEDALTGSPVELDFVYGREKNEIIQPLDGQQRLTTLFLLHWFIANKEGKLDETTKERLKKFTYETRTSSREFCKELIEKSIDYQNLLPIVEERGITDKNQLSETIKNSSWFVISWKNDPTIKAMLIMLDAIQNKFNDSQNLWIKLTDENNPPITFLYLKLENFGLSDDLYIKMNARGKSLTSFENFKADLVGHIEKQEWEKDGRDPQNTISHKLDTDWIEIFWKNKSEKHKIDEIYFAFLNRYYLNALITAKKGDDYLFKGEDLDKNNETFQYLYGNKSNDSTIEYSGFDIYNPKIKEEGKKEAEVFSQSFYECLAKTLNNFYESFQDKRRDDINNLFLPLWEIKNQENEFCFIPQYRENNTISTLTRQQRVVFHAICRYFEIGVFDEKLFKQWIRVVWNIVENSPSDSNMTGAIRLIDELGEYSHNIYSHLKDRKITGHDFASEQMKEEKKKACLLFSPKGDQWSTLFEEAENFPLFKGAIRSLFKNHDNFDVVDEDFIQVHTCWNNAQKYFGETGVKNEYKKNAQLLRAFISRVDWKHLWWNGRVFDNEKDTWTRILKERKYHTAVHDILLGNIDIVENDNHEPLHKQLYETELLVFVAENMKGSWIRDIHYHRAIYPSAWGIFLDAEKRDELLNKPEITIYQGTKVPNTSFIQGWDINFEYECIKYKWNRDRKIYLLNENNERTKDTNNIDIRIEENDITNENFLEKLKELNKLCLNSNPSSAIS